MRTTPKVRRATGIVFATVVATSLAACGGGSPGSSSSGSASTAVTQIGFWDPYPQYDDSSDWAKYVQACAPSGATIKRTTAPNTDLINNLTTAVREDNAPDVVFLDNPAVPEASASGLLAPLDTVGFAAGDADANLAGPGTVDGKTYGVPIGANTLGLYYNEDVLKKAGVDPATITDWASLNAALEKVTKAGSKGITFAGVPGEEGTFQFLPWFWGAGANLKDIGSDAGGCRPGSWSPTGWPRGTRRSRPSPTTSRRPGTSSSPVTTPSPRTARGSPRPRPRRSSRSR